MKTLNILLFAAIVGVLISSFLITAATNQTYDSACIQSALVKRETAIGTAFQTFVAGLTQISTKRTQDLVAAYGIEDKKTRSAAIKLAWKTYKDEYKVISQTFKDERKSAWNTFKEDRTACKTPNESADRESNEIRL